LKRVDCPPNFDKKFVFISTFIVRISGLGLRRGRPRRRIPFERLVNENSRVLNEGLLTQPYSFFGV